MKCHKCAATIRGSAVFGNVESAYCWECFFEGLDLEKAERIAVEEYQSALAALRAITQEETQEHYDAARREIEAERKSKDARDALAAFLQKSLPEGERQSGSDAKGDGYQ